ncbi:S-adenosyl-L-methionine-dependent methyltransferase [Chaetomidium leptoderma]|uniref:S-adenosyl-L-methionine-dependent methyltransferase n=1 Tax=Chaetomidium leptoderma TaxID=669021 RepID=A0AAN6ZU83_9PEZI|nr:S-adenosyl-L-methionine-dependent methyltransferase [Chaetomidium leptoderma]
MTEPAQPHIEVDTDDDRDSVISDDISAFTASITSSVLDYPVEHGRRYHAFRAGVYILPNDELEQERLDLSHAVMTKAIGDKLFLAPLNMDKVHRVLDIGTGTGIWLSGKWNMLLTNWPSINQVLGNDLSPIQSPWVPPNVKFEVDDVECPWIYEAPFDFIFCRYMTCCIKDWPGLVKSIHDNLKPGGWAEFQDFDLQYYSEDGSLKDDSHTLKWITALLEAANKLGREPCTGPRLDGWVRDAGFTKVTHQRFRVPIGAWPKDRRMKELGMYNIAQVLSGLEAFSLRLFCNVLGWQENEVLVLLSHVRRELKSPGLHAQFDFHVAYGQKEE